MSKSLTYNTVTLKSEILSIIIISYAFIYDISLNEKNILNLKMHRVNGIPTAKVMS